MNCIDELLADILATAQDVFRWREKRKPTGRIHQALRTMPYREYLQTDHWQDIRRRALKRAGWRCQLCNSGGRLNVHHRTYERRGSERLADVIVLCENCHKKNHGRA